ncbi:aspartate/glutamate racemase family protein [Entomospira entomophila]|uniref:Glutamate racemase n=1 Tax=Entomospira entomophila TaxID=2719988 RepID=A0A968KVZ3_9SPIO|nr:aspartate/glutamate racemase family protein [Entomospira entomophilus]NIZ40335.1 hypothetical protein [Entomospira entomophilus]WDI35894.1 aspartate/glutamate racemase family protein [Entomospira entomophilus]
MSNIKILVFDSGQGGFPYFQAIRAILSPHHIIATIDYLADNDAFPYGTKSNQELQERFHYLASALSKLDTPYDLLIIACNTASLHGRDIFMQYFPAEKLVFTTPTLALSSLEDNTSHLILMATTATCRFYESEKNITLIAADALVRWIESYWDSATEVERLEYLESFWQEYLISARNSIVILGCTHFLHIKEHLERMHPEHHMQFIDTRDYVAQETLKRLTSQRPQADHGSLTIGKLFLTNNNQSDQEHYISIIGEYHLEFSTHKLI